MSQYRVGIIGCGGRAKEHVPALKADARCKVVALADLKTETAHALNVEAGFGATVYGDHQEMLIREALDVVIVCLWTPLHLPVFKDCVARGVRAVLSEKPMAPTWGECQEFGEIAQASGTLLTFCHQRRFAEGNLRARQMIRDGVFGDIQRLDLYSPPNLLDCGTHTFDQAMSFLGEVPARWVLGAVDTSSLLNWFNVRAEAMMTGTLVFENGVRASVQVGGPDMDLWGGVRIIGSKGFLEVLWDGDFKNGRVYDDPSWRPPTLEQNRDVQMRGVVSNALDCLESGKEPELSWQKALRAAEIIYGFYESVRRHARVTLPLSGFTDNPLHALLDSGVLSPKE